ncbi:hypothetical protein [Streptomyces azureus]|uniref:Uncharacterized protein n=1 Tax=Streptomyces azureus TaxID=146537 RepID=A0A0K8PK52_STRAJ|nr:hypothetical protein [Streptomyces azureus]GAP48270.1 uncharacterized protein SAZU_3097 [Streptomyces azureus]
MASSVAGLCLLPAGWGTDDTGGENRGSAPLLRLLTGAWPVYVMGAASLALLGLAELALRRLSCYSVVMPVITRNWSLGRSIIWLIRVRPPETLRTLGRGAA